ncbi:Protein sym-1 [Tetrabaena socialis]|uniref:Protein sym-1 n=1 Tax=Tetrabaena socialis TaxID=47790 RepID=A0A2J8AI96_9CHLO|nr:Protein sym-1 [Tetrabaena socialis]|eukprot:PNH12235.1 Protein sym-1 [Tetrabaena socialis]
MRGCALIAGGAGGWSSRAGFNRLRSERRDVRRSSSSAASSGAGPSGRVGYFEKVAGWQAPLKAAVTSGTLSAVGDLLAQALLGQTAAREGTAAPPYDPSRTGRMFGYGFSWYGPCQYYWYNLLDFLLPFKSTASFLTKVTANQLILAPITLSTVFAFNLALMGKADAIHDKLRNDLWPTMQNGWKFWIPAASLNFYCIPLKHQVLYMSACGVLWTAYLSYASNMPAAPALAPAPAPAPPAPKKCCGGKAK